MSAAERYRIAAKDLELEAERCGEHVPDDSVIPADLAYAIQRAIFAGMAAMLEVMADVEEKREAA